MLDELIESFRRRMEPRWDDLRERRVLIDVERAVEQRSSRRRARRRALAVAIPLSFSVAALVVAYVVGVDFGKRSAARTPSPAAERAVASSQPAPGPVGGAADFTESRVLSDGSRLELSHAARIEVRSESKKRVELVQNEGHVHYEVSHVPGRAFVVVARGVLIQVKGTVFVVDIDAGKVSVSVERGLVRVAAGSGEVELGVGDELSTPADQGTSADRTGDPSPEGGAPSRAPRADFAPLASASALLDRADAERRSGDLAAAATTLRELLGRYPSDRRAALAWFTLGKVERARDHAGSAAKAFQTSSSLAPDGAVGEDALAEEAVAWAAASNAAAARLAAEQYLRRFPNGTHVARMQHILE
ncbi:MAG TPA: FecR domain-containing protein [Polyangiaceae bacterium]|nr:FecR domain-containing protein [Polyangiaceae bacterium]